MFGVFNRLATLSRISLMPPKASVNRHGLAITAIVKNESRYIKEWVQFHYGAGVRHFYIYDNGSTDRTQKILMESLPGDALTITPWAQNLGDARYKHSTIHNQVLAYAHAASNFGAEYRWFAFIDVDEFLIPRQSESLPLALESLDHCENISLPWHMYGTSGHKTDPGGSVLEKYRYRYSNPSTGDSSLRNFKCIVDPCALTSIRVHSMQTNGEWLTHNDQGKPAHVKQRFASDFYSSEVIQLNHYYTRSEQEFINKMNKGHIIKGRSDRYAQKLPGMLQKIDSDAVEDRCAIDYLERIGVH